MNGIAFFSKVIFLISRCNVDPMMIGQQVKTRCFARWRLMTGACHNYLVSWRALEPPVPLFMNIMTNNSQGQVARLRVQPQLARRGAHTQKVVGRASVDATMMLMLSHLPAPVVIV